MNHPFAKLPLIGKLFEDPREQARRKLEAKADPTAAIITAQTAAPGSTQASTPFMPWRRRSPLSLPSPEETALVEKLLAETDASPIFEAGAPRLTEPIRPRNARVEMAYYTLDGRYYSTVVVYGWPSWFRDAILDPLLSVKGVTISSHKHRIPLRYAAKQLRAQAAKLRSELESTKADTVDAMQLEQRIAEAEAQLRAVGTRASVFYQLSVYVRVSGRTLEEWADKVNEVHEVIRAMGATYRDVPGDQRDGFIATMPYADDRLAVVKNFTSSALADTLPFLTREVKQPGGVLYGISQLNSTPLIASPFRGDGVDTILVLGSPGQGKTFWVRCLLGRLALLGVQLLVIDPLGDYRKWFSVNRGSQIIEFFPGSKFHVNPFRRGVDTAGVIEPVDEKILRLKPLFRLLLGGMYDGYHADTALEAALKSFYGKFGEEEHLMSDFLEVLQARITDTEGERGNELRAIHGALYELTIEGSYADFFAHKTNVNLNAKRVLFNLKPSIEEHKLFAAYMAITLAKDLAMSSTHRKLIVADEAHELFKGQSGSNFDPIAESLAEFPRRARHWNTAMLWATQFVGTTAEEARQSPEGQAAGAILTLTTAWVLFKTSKAGVELVQQQAGLAPEIGQTLVIEGDPPDVGNVPRPGVYYSRGIATPFWSVGFDFEAEEDDLKSGVADSA